MSAATPLPVEIYEAASRGELQKVVKALGLVMLLQQPGTREWDAI